MSLPISVGMLSTFLFQVIDTYFVGQLGANALAALSFSSTVYFLLVGLFIGFSVGVSVIVGKAAGVADQAKIQKVTMVALLLCFSIAAFCSAIGIVFIEPVFTLLGASMELMPDIKAYTIPLLLGMPLLTVGLVAGGILRATGNITKPEVLMAVAGIINLFFDYALIFGKFGFPELGIQGAAYATVSSWVFVIGGMLLLLWRDNLLAFFTKSSTSATQIIQEMLHLGAPAIVTQIIGPLTIMYLTYLLAKESEMAVAAFGVAGRIETLLMIGILGVSTAITPFIAQNSGAKQQGRIDEAIVFGGKASTYLGLLVAILLWLLVEPMVALFSDNALVVEYAANYFYLVSLSYCFYGLYLVTTSIFNGLQLPVDSLKISLVKPIVFTLPLTLAGAWLWSVNGVFIGLALSNILAGIYASIQMQKEFHNSHSSLEGVNFWQTYIRDIKTLFSVKK